MTMPEREKVLEYLKEIQIFTAAARKILERHPVPRTCPTHYNPNEEEAC